MKPTPLKEDELIRLQKEGTIVEGHQKGPKVILTADKVIKFFYLKGYFTSDLLYPYAKRFVKNAFALNKLGIQTVYIEHFYYCKAKRVYVVCYKKLHGTDLRHVDLAENHQLLTLLAKYINFLHNKGVFYRGIHLGNIICFQEKFALIDIADVSFRAKSLSHKQRIKNLKHFCNYRADASRWTSEHFMQFMQAYLDANPSFSDKVKQQYYSIKK